jgi:hypothetical protein
LEEVGVSSRRSCDEAVGSARGRPWWAIEGDRREMAGSQDEEAPIREALCKNNRRDLTIKRGMRKKKEKDRSVRSDQIRR